MNANGTPSLDTEEPLGSSTQQDCEGATLENATLGFLSCKITASYSINQPVEIIPELKDERGARWKIL